MSTNSILTSRLILKPLTVMDDQNLFGLHSDPEVMKYIRDPDTDIFQTKKRIKEVLGYSANNKGLGLWSAFKKDQKTFIGWGLLVHIEHDNSNPIEVGFRLHQSFWKKGFGHEIGNALIDYAKSLGLKHVCGITRDDNIASQKTLIKCGLSFIENRKYYDQDVLYFERKL